MGNFVSVARLADLPDQGGLEVHHNGHRLVLFKSGGEIFALDAICPHRGGPLAAGWVENGSVFCPLHGWEFTLRDGGCPTNPEKAVTSYPVRITGDEVQICTDPRKEEG